MSQVAGSMGFLRSSHRLTVVGTLLIVATIAAAVATVWDLRRDAIATYQQEMTSLGLVFREQTSRDMQAVDLVLHEVRDQVLAAATSDQFNLLAGTEALNHALSDRLRNLPQASGLALVGADGQLVNTTSMWPPPQLDLTARDYFQHFRDHDDNAAFVSVPIENRITGTWTIFLAHRVNGPHHEFLGVLLGVMETRYFETFYKQITAYESGSMTLLRRDGTILARYPHGDAIIGTKMPAGTEWYGFVNNGSGGSYRSPGYLDGTARVVSVHPLTDYPLVANVTISEDEALEDWRRQSAIIAFAAAIVVIGFALLFRALARQFDALEQQTAELARSGAALRRSEERFRDFAEASSDWFWEQDAELRFTWVSQMSTMRGLVDPSIGKRRWEIGGHNMSEEQWTAHKADLAARRPFRDFRIEHVAKDGSRLYLSISGQPVFDAAGAFQGYRGTGRNVTAHVEAETQRHGLERQLHHAQRIELLGTLAGGIAHDLNNTLVPVVALSKVMLKQHPEASVEHNNLEMIYRSGVQARDLVKQILVFARKETATKRVVELASFIRDALPLLRAAVPSTVAITYTAAMALPPVLADPSQLHQILINLVTNAAQAIGDASGSIAIDLVAATREDGIGDGTNAALRLVIRDTGHGMDSPTLARIFEPFFTTKNVGEGTGLGLAVVHGIVGSHGGKIEVQSRTGQGTRFSILLPCAEQAAVLEAAEA